MCDHLTEYVDLRDVFDIDNLCWEVVFKGTLSGRYDYEGEWDETLEIDDHLIQPLPEDWFE